MADHMQPSAGQNLTWHVASHLGSEIVGGDFAPGDAIPNETQLGEKYAVGRSSVREAVKLLTAKGLVNARPRRGTVVCPVREWNFLDPDVLAWAQSGDPGADFLVELAEMRLAVEPMAASLAAKFGDEEAVARIRAALDKMIAAGKGAADPIAADLEFHQAIVAASGNRFMQPLVAVIGTALQFSFRATNAAMGAPVGEIPGHEKVLIAIEAGDGDGARDAMTELLERARRIIEAGPAAASPRSRKTA